MNTNKKTGLLNLAKKTTTIIGAALAAISGINTNIKSSGHQTLYSGEANQMQSVGKNKPMPILKLNVNKPESSQFVANHQSHRSHSSHRSHYSHRSLAMFS